MVQDFAHHEEQLICHKSLGQKRRIKREEQTRFILQSQEIQLDGEVNQKAKEIAE
jgi:hypothetical protein